MAASIDAGCCIHFMRGSWSFSSWFIGAECQRSSVNKQTPVMRYRVILVPSGEGFAVGCPALPGCWSQGATEEEALENIREAIKDWLIVAQETLLNEEEGARMVEVVAYCDSRTACESSHCKETRAAYWNLWGFPPSLAPNSLRERLEVRNVDVEQNPAKVQRMWPNGQNRLWSDPNAQSAHCLPQVFRRNNIQRCSRLDTELWLA